MSRSLMISVTSIHCCSSCYWFDYVLCLRNHQAAGHRERELNRRHPSAARCLPRGDVPSEWTAIGSGSSRRTRRSPRKPSSSCSRRGRIHFEGHAAELRRSKSVPEGVSFLEVVHAAHALARLVGTQNRHSRRRRPRARERADLHAERGERASSGSATRSRPALATWRASRRAHRCTSPG